LQIVWQNRALYCTSLLRRPRTECQLWTDRASCRGQQLGLDQPQRAMCCYLGGCQGSAVTCAGHLAPSVATWAAAKDGAPAKGRPCVHGSSQVCVRRAVHRANFFGSGSQPYFGSCSCARAGLGGGVWDGFSEEPVLELARSTPKRPLSMYRNAQDSL
jgi:hypothetical protein